MKQLMRIIALLASMSLFAADNQPWYKRLFNPATWYAETQQSIPAQKPVANRSLSTYFSWIWPKNRDQQANPAYAEEKKREDNSLIELKKEYAKEQSIIKANMPKNDDTALVTREKYKKIRDARDKLDTKIIPAIQEIESLPTNLRPIAKERINLRDKYQTLRSQLNNLDEVESKLKKEGKTLAPSAQKKSAQARQQLLSNIQPIRKRLDQIALELGEYYELKK